VNFLSSGARFPLGWYVACFKGLNANVLKGLQEWVPNALVDGGIRSASAMFFFLPDDLAAVMLPLAQAAGTST